MDSGARGALAIANRVLRRQHSFIYDTSDVMWQLRQLRVGIETRGDVAGYIRDSPGFRHTEEPSAPTLRDLAGFNFAKRTQVTEAVMDLRPSNTGTMMSQP